MSSTPLFKCQGPGLRSVTVSRTSEGEFTMEWTVYVLERFRRFALSGLREVPDIEELLSCTRLSVEQSEGQLEYGRVHIEFWTESYHEFRADSFSETAPRSS